MLFEKGPLKSACPPIFISYYVAVAVSKEQKHLYSQKVKPYKTTADDLKKEIATVKVAARRNKGLEAYFSIKTAILGIQRANTLVQMSLLSQEIQNIKNDSYLNDARKELSGHISDLLKVVCDTRDGGLTENLEDLERLSELTPEQKFNLLQGF